VHWAHGARLRLQLGSLGRQAGQAGSTGEASAHDGVTIHGGGEELIRISIRQ
jgi:hypothetical protein